MTCTQALRVQAYFDAELAPDETAAIEKHLPTCPGCRDLLAELDQTRAALENQRVDIRAPAALRARILGALDAEESRPAREAVVLARASRGGTIRSKPFWFGAFAGLGVSALAATLFALFLFPVFARPMVDDLMSAHLESLEPGKLFAIASSEHHTVKPWFGGHADVSPTVADFTEQGFKLEGGRADEIFGQRAAVTVYQHGKHTINVFTWANKNTLLPETTTRSGYRLLFWRSDDLAYCAVSDTTWSSLEELHKLIDAQIAAERRPDNLH